LQAKKTVLNAVLISTYDLGRQPFAMASAAAWLREAGVRVACLDLAVEPFDEGAVRGAGLVALSLPMHTATRLAPGLIERIRGLNPRAHVCCFGLYAPINEAYLRGVGADTILGGEFEAGLVALARRLKERAAPSEGAPQPEPVVSLARQRFRVPERSLLPPLEKYAKLQLAPGEERTVGYTEATRGCKHLCRHCPIVPVYGGAFRVVQRDVVLEDVRRQVAAGAQHITFGDPDFFNGPAHGLTIARALHAEFPRLSYDVTIKVEHLLRHRRLLPALRDTGCLFVTSAVESLDDRVLALFAKGHTRADFSEAVCLFRELGLQLNPTFVPFTPWTTLAGYAGFLAAVAELDLVEAVAPVQYAIRLLVTASSRLLELPELRAASGDFDAERLIYPWSHPDPRVDRLYEEVTAAVQEGQSRGEGRREIFTRIAALARAAGWRSLPAGPLPAEAVTPAGPLPVGIAPPAAGAGPPSQFIPHITEPWYC
jgi:radical SAM superfamily enzyme YgiQ (UPF0313 family)